VTVSRQCGQCRCTRSPTSESQSRGQL
jgi:hypothetical protein